VAFAVHSGKDMCEVSVDFIEEDFVWLLQINKVFNFCDAFIYLVGV